MRREKTSWRPFAAGIGGFLGAVSGLQTTHLAFAFIGAAMGAWIGSMLYDASR